MGLCNWCHFSGLTEYQSFLLRKIICYALGEKKDWFASHRALGGCPRLRLSRRCSPRRRCKCPRPRLAPGSDAGCCRCGSQTWNVHRKVSARATLYISFTLENFREKLFKGVNSSRDERVKLSIKEEGYHLLYID